MEESRPVVGRADDAVSAQAPSRLHDVYPARIEVEYVAGAGRASRWSGGFLRGNLRDRTLLLLLLCAALAQVADTITTAIALQRGSLFEANALMRNAVTQPAVAGALKLLLVLLVCTLAMMRLPSRYARAAVGLAFGISVLAPLQNILQLLLSH